MTDWSTYATDRDAAFILAVRDDDWSGVRKLIEKYGLALPRQGILLKAAIYKAVAECVNIPDEIKQVAKFKCIELGFSPEFR